MAIDEQCSDVFLWIFENGSTGNDYYNSLGEPQQPTETCEMLRYVDSLWQGTTPTWFCSAYAQFSLFSLEGVSLAGSG